MSSADMQQKVLRISQTVSGKKLLEGAGVQICRTIGYQDVRVDPFLMLDEMRLPAERASAGFPEHPHRGFETCTLMMDGKMKHEDSCGNKGVIEAGGAQWMTAGRGIIHSEMPVVTTGDLHGFQLWINLPAKEKMTQPRYQDIPKSDIPSVPLGGDCGHARVVAGILLGTEGPIKLRNPGLLLDVSIHAGSTWSCEQIFPQEWNGFCYIYEGAGILGDQNVKMQHAYIFDRGTGDILVAKAGSEGLKFLLIAGKPINEPIVQYGPFVMNHELEIAQAFDDYRSGKLQNPEDDPFSPGEG